MLDINWDRVMKRCVRLIIKSHNNDTPIKSCSELHKQYILAYDKINEHTFRYHIRQILGLEKGQSINSENLLMLAGMYNSVSLNMLAKDVRVKYSGKIDGSNFVFLKLKSNHEPKFLYSISTKLKEKYKNSILFISYDNDTLVILCKDKNAAQRLIKVFTFTDEGELKDV